MEKQCKITIDGKTVYADRGAKLSEVLSEGGFRVAMPCGGRGICRKCKVLADGREVLACKYLVTDDVSIILPETKDDIYEEKSEGIIDKCRIAVDIGTTTVEAAAVSAEGNRVLARVRFANPQSVYGGDVISRIFHSSQKGAGALNAILLGGLKKMLKRIVPENADVTRMDFCGNTVMLHLLLGMDCAGIGEYPYTPVFLKSQTVPARELGFDYDCEAHTLPCISSFVGGDVTAGLLTLPLPSPDKYALYMDIGTNAEIVLFDGKKYFAASAPAGPCMEGCNISCGMSALDGAITHFSYPDKITFIGKSPKGLCGSGLIDAVGQLVKVGVIDASGDMAKDYSLCDGVTLRREDVRQYQLAKSAVRASTEELLDVCGIGADRVERVYLAGGFSAHIDIANAVASGLIDKAFSDKCLAVGNRSLDGCVLYSDNAERADEIASRAKSVDLGDSPGFADKFVKYMSFGR